MGWTDVLAYTFENHAAVDESGTGNDGLVRLPDASRWVDVPTRSIATAILFDDPRSMVTVPANQTLAGWAAFKVRVTFCAAAVPHRLNLVEGDRAFAFFVEADASLMGTVFDGANWYGVRSAPNLVKPGVWYVADFTYDPASTLMLRLNTELVGMAPTHGDAVRPVGPVGIKIGTWPGGDGRYAFIGLIGPIHLSTIDPVQEVASRLGKLVCPGYGTTGDMFNDLMNVVQNELTPTERAAATKAGEGMVGSALAVISATLQTAKDLPKTLTTLQSLSSRAETLLLQTHVAGTSFLADPQFAAMANELSAALAAASPAATDVFMAQVLKCGTQIPLSQARVADLNQRFPNLASCLTGLANPSVFPNPFGPLPGTCTLTCTDGSSIGPGTLAPPAGPTCPPAEVHVHIHCCGKHRSTPTKESR